MGISWKGLKNPKEKEGKHKSVLYKRPLREAFEKLVDVVDKLSDEEEKV